MDEENRGPRSGDINLLMEHLELCRLAHKAHKAGDVELRNALWQQALEVDHQYRLSMGFNEGQLAEIDAIRKEKRAGTNPTVEKMQELRSRFLAAGVPVDAIKSETYMLEFILKMGIRPPGYVWKDKE